MVEHADLLAGVAALEGARLQKLRLADDGRLLLELFAGERKELVVDPRPPAPSVRAGGAELERGDKPPREQAVFRKELVPARLESATLLPGSATAQLLFERKDGGRRALYLELSRDDPRLVLTGSFDKGERVLLVLGSVRPRDGRDLRRGRPWELPRAPGPLPTVDEGGLRAKEHRAERAAASDLKELRARLKAESKRLARLVRALERDRERHGDPDALAMDGELFKTVMGRVTRGQKSVAVTDWEGAAKEIELDPTKNPQQNLELFFSRARRAREGQRRIAPRLDEARARSEEVDDARAAIRSEPDEADVARALALLEDPRAAPSPRRRAAKQGGRQPWRSFRLHGDVVARVGRSARDNDTLTLRARGNDLWLHARGTVGAHVIVPCPDGEAPTELLLDAARLAAWFSPLRDETAVDVQYTRRKHLDKPGKGAPGLVLVRKEKVIRVRRDEEAARALLAAEVPA